MSQHLKVVYELHFWSLGRWLELVALVSSSYCFNSSEVEHAWLTVSFPGPPRAIAYLCTARATLTTLRTEDIWPIFCFSWPFMSFEAQRKSQYAKLLQFFVANFRFEVDVGVVCRYFIWALSLLFGPCRLSEFITKITNRITLLWSCLFQTFKDFKLY